MNKLNKTEPAIYFIFCGDQWLLKLLFPFLNIGPCKSYKTKNNNSCFKPGYNNHRRNFFADYYYYLIFSRKQQDNQEKNCVVWKIICFHLSALADYRVSDQSLWNFRNLISLQARNISKWFGTTRYNYLSSRRRETLNFISRRKHTRKKVFLVFFRLLIKFNVPQQ